MRFHLNVTIHLLERIYISYYSLLSNPNAQYNMLVTYICINGKNKYCLNQRLSVIALLHIHVSAAYRSRIYDNVDTPRSEPYQFVQATYVVCS